MNNEISMTPEQAFDIARQICDQHPCNWETQRRIRQALEIIYITMFPSHVNEPATNADSNSKPREKIKEKT